MRCSRVPASSAHARALPVDLDEPGEVGEVEQHAGRHRDAGEAVTGADGLEAHALRRPPPARPAARRRSMRGVSTRCGRTVAVRPQFCQVPPGRVTGRPSLRRGRSAARRRRGRPRRGGSASTRSASLAALGVAEPDPVADPQPAGGRALQRRLHLAGALARQRLQTRRPDRQRLARRQRRAGGDPAAAQHGRDVGQRLAHHLERERRRRRRIERPVAVEEVAAEQAAAGGDLGDRPIACRVLERAGAAAVDELERGDGASRPRRSRRGARAARRASGAASSG